MEHERHIDTRSAFCPAPPLLLTRVMRDTELGTISRLADRPAAAGNIPGWVATAGHVALEDDGTLRFVVRKGR